MNTLDVCRFQEKCSVFFSALNFNLLPVLFTGRCLIWTLFITVLAGLPAMAQEPAEERDITIHIGSAGDTDQEGQGGAIRIGRDERSGDHVIQVVPPPEKDENGTSSIGPILVVPEISAPRLPIPPTPPRVPDLAK
jgi:hypothetical protein